MTHLDPITSFSGRYAFLSNFYPCVIHHEQIFYPTVEHAFQANKTTNRTKRREISRLSTPGQAKRAGRSLNLIKGWEEIKIPLMRNLLTIKFHHPDLKKLLLSTNDRYLIEGNHWNDEFWGCIPIKSTRGTTDVIIWHGKNHLGKLLMEIREGLIDFDG